MSFDHHCAETSASGRCFAGTRSFQEQGGNINRVGSVCWNRLSFKTSAVFAFGITYRGDDRESTHQPEYKKG